MSTTSPPPSSSPHFSSSSSSPPSTSTSTSPTTTPTTSPTTTTTPKPAPTAPAVPVPILFLHPDLGIGGAERLLLDAALGLQARGHATTIMTSHRDEQHCFPEAADPALLDVRVRGGGLVPASVLGGRFTVLCAVGRQVALLVGVALWGVGSAGGDGGGGGGGGGKKKKSELQELRPGVVFVDQLSAGLPLLRVLCALLGLNGGVRGGVRVLFYCHFPDLLLAKGRQRWWKRAYRLPFDWLEEWSMGFADVICVNSGFTKGVVSRQWPGLVKGRELEIVYPCVDIKEKKQEKEGDERDDSLVWKDKDILLSINRFEKKKDIGLAIRAYAGLGKHGRKGVRLVVAGGYDNRVQENVTYHKELTQLADSLGLKSTTTKNVVTALGVPDDIDVLFLLSVPNSLKDALLKSARLLIYTPSNEHFGIVPLEAMLAGTPVLAANTGGPLETVVDGETGWLRPPDDVEAWTAVMDKVLHKLSDAQLQKMAEAGKKRVVSEFSDVKMAERLDNIIDKMSSMPSQSLAGLGFFLALAGIVPLVGAIIAIYLWRLYSK